VVARLARSSNDDQIGVIGAGNPQASATLNTSIEIVARALTGPRDGTYTRSSALFDRPERQLEACPHRVDSNALALRDFRLLDGTMASLAEQMGLLITDYDTVGMRS
jgi:hypothetical protein